MAKCPHCFGRDVKFYEHQNTTYDGEMTTEIRGKCGYCGHVWEVASGALRKQGDPDKKRRVRRCPCGEIVRYSEKEDTTKFLKAAGWEVFITSKGKPVALCKVCSRKAGTMARSILGLVKEEDLTIGELAKRGENA